MPVGEAFRLPFIEIKPFWREGRPHPYKIQHPANPKFEINLLKRIPREAARLVDGEIHPFAALGVGEGKARRKKRHTGGVVLCAVLSVSEKGHFP